MGAHARKLRAAGILERIPMDFLDRESAATSKRCNALVRRRRSISCIFAIAPVRVLSLSDMASMLAAVTGWNTSDYEIMLLRRAPPFT
jgi:hypothetical protein